MIKIKRVEDCCGCTACQSICAHGAISMHPDSLGFLYPVVDEAKCTNCGLCEKVCAFNDCYDKTLNLDAPILFGARHVDIKEVETSRSGAAFVALSDYVLGLGGVVYGVGYEKHFHVVHKRATTKLVRDEFKGSKYTQSDLSGIFRQVRDDLKNGYTVLFSGTPCQIAGLKSFVGKKLSENLILVDIICHGTPSPNIWRDYLAYIENLHGAKATSVDFRNKRDFGWHDHKESFVIKGETITSEWYKHAFYKHIMLRPSCGVCHFCNTKRPGDITLADFWGWEKSDSIINADDKGISLLFVNTEKGKHLLENVKNSLELIPVELKNCLQPNMQHPSYFHPKWRKFAKDYGKYGFNYVYENLDKYDIPTTGDKLKSKFKGCIKRIIGR